MKAPSSALCFLLLIAACAAPAPVRVSLNECTTEFQSFPPSSLPVRLEFSSDTPLAPAIPGIRRADSTEIAFLQSTLVRSLEGVFAQPTALDSAVLSVRLRNSALSLDAGYLEIESTFTWQQVICKDEFAAAVANADKPSERITRSGVGRILLSASRCAAQIPLVESDRCGSTYIAKTASSLLPFLPAEDLVYDCAFMRNGTYGPECISYKKVRRGKLNWALTLR